MLPTGAAVKSPHERGLKKVKSMFDSLFNAIILLFTFLALLAPCEAKPPFHDINIPQGEKSTYEIREGGTTELTSHVISKEERDGKTVYVIRTESMEMILTPNGMRPILVKKKKKGRELSIMYNCPRPGRVLFKDFGPAPRYRNKVMKISENSYDFNTMLDVMRCYPFDREKIKFKLVTKDRVLGVYAKIAGDEKVPTPCGDFDCYLIEGGVSGIKGKIVRKKLLFWVEKEFPHRLVKFKYGEQVITLKKYEVPQPLEGNLR